MKYVLKDKKGNIVNYIEIDEEKQLTDEAYIPEKGFSIEPFVEEIVETK